MNSTEEMILKMMQQPIAKSILDSGSAYGYQYERRKDLANAPDGHLEFSVNDGKLQMSATKSMFRYLCANLEYEPVLTEYLEVFAATQDDTWGIGLMEDFARSLYCTPSSDNTYNFDNILDGCFIFTEFKLSDTDIVIVSTHNGCDVRGGYSDPKVFKVLEEGMLFWAINDYTAECECGHITFSGDDAATVTLDIDFIEGDEPQGEKAALTESGQLICPRCMKPVRFYM